MGRLAPFSRKLVRNSGPRADRRPQQVKLGMMRTITLLRADTGFFKDSEGEPHSPRVTASPGGLPGPRRVGLEKAVASQVRRPRRPPDESGMRRDSSTAVGTVVPDSAGQSASNGGVIDPLIQGSQQPRPSSDIRDTRHATTRSRSVGQMQLRLSQRPLISALSGDGV